VFVGSPLHQLIEIHSQKKAGRKRSTSSRRDANIPEGEVTEKDVKEVDLESRLEDSAREKAQLEKVNTTAHINLPLLNVHLEQCLDQALVNNEVTEISNKTNLQELQDVRETIS
jgi:hypothetical protein